MAQCNLGQHVCYTQEMRNLTENVGIWLFFWSMDIQNMFKWFFSKIIPYFDKKNIFVSLKLWILERIEIQLQTQSNKPCQVNLSAINC